MVTRSATAPRSTRISARATPTGGPDMALPAITVGDRVSARTASPGRSLGSNGTRPSQGRFPSAALGADEDDHSPSRVLPIAAAVVGVCDPRPAVTLLAYSVLAGPALPVASNLAGEATADALCPDSGGSPVGPRLKAHIPAGVRLALDAVVRVGVGNEAQRRDGHQDRHHRNQSAFLISFSLPAWRARPQSTSSSVLSSLSFGPAGRRRRKLPLVRGIAPVNQAAVLRTCK